MTATHAQASPVTDEAVRAFAQLRRDDVDYASGKGANLGELTSAGLPEQRLLLDAARTDA